MKQRIQLGLASVFLLLLCSGCAVAQGTSPTPAATPAPMATPTPIPAPTPTPTSVLITTDLVTLEADPAWQSANEGEGMFFDVVQNQGFGLLGSSQLGSYTPEAFFQALVEMYAQESQISKEDEALSDGQTADGVTYRWGTFQLAFVDGGYMDVMMVVSEEKNVVVTLAAQAMTTSELEEQLNPILTQLRESITFLPGNGDTVSGQHFLMEDDGSELILEKDGSFRYYRTAGDHEGDRYEGTYEVWRGQAAYDQVASMEAYGLTAEEMEETLKANMNGYLPGGSTPQDILNALDPSQDETDTRPHYHICRDTFYAVMLYNRTLVMGGAAQDISTDTLYIGYYIPELKLVDMINANTAAYHPWTLQ